MARPASGTRHGRATYVEVARPTSATRNGRATYAEVARQPVPSGTVMPPLC